MNADEVVSLEPARAIPSGRTSPATRSPVVTLSNRRTPIWMRQLFREADRGHPPRRRRHLGLKRSLNKWHLTAPLGVGATIGARDLRHHRHGHRGRRAPARRRPSIVLLVPPHGGSLRLRGALLRGVRARWCRSPGSAYTYSYAALGELVAWIIGWDLIVEYAGREHRRGDQLGGTLPRADEPLRGVDPRLARHRLPLGLRRGSGA